MQVKIREAVSKERAAIFHFLISQKRADEKDEERWFKKWELVFEKNPLLGQGINHPIGWVIEKEDGGIGGYLGNIILPYFYNGKIYRAACITDVVADRDLRFSSLDLFKEYLMQKNVDIFINSSANRAAGKVFKGLKFFKLPEENYDTMYYFFIRPSKALYFFASRSLLGFLACPATVIAGFFYKAYLYFRDKILIKPEKNGRNKILTISSEKLSIPYDLFFKQTAVQKPNLMFWRTKETLCWRFDKSYNVNKTDILCCYEGEKMLGYAIVEKRSERKSGLTRLRLIDILALQNDKTVIDRLIGAAYSYGKKEGADLLECYFLPAVVRQRLGHLAHYKKRRGGGVFIRLVAPELLKIDPALDWYATCIDGDTSF